MSEPLEEAKAWIKKNPEISITAALMVVVVLIIAFSGGTKGKKFKALPYVCQEIDAQVSAKSFIEKQLKAPSTAEFHHISNRSLGDRQYEVVYDVDAQNSFGVPLRNRWTLVIKCDGDYTRLVSSRYE